MTHEKFQKELASIPDATLTQRVEDLISKLCNTGGRSFTMSVPPRLDDVDILLTELVKRFKTLTNDLKYDKRSKRRF